MQTYEVLKRRLSLLAPSVLAIAAVSCAATTQTTQLANQNESALNTTAARVPNETDAATLRRGKILFLQCRACHSTERDGEHKVGPNLHGVIGAAAASKPGFNYSAALVAADLIWTGQTLDEFLKGPNASVSGTIMAFSGISVDADRQALIAFLISETN